jgi:hypothetical protein
MRTPGMPRGDRVSGRQPPPSVRMNKEHQAERTVASRGGQTLILTTIARE